MSPSNNSPSGREDECPTHKRRPPRDHDLLSFSSLLVRRFDGLSIGLTLLGVLLDERGPDLRVPSAAGNFFQVTMIKSKRLLKSRFLPIVLGDPSMPKVVALKIPLITDHIESTRSRKLWTVMAKELQILKNDHLSRHTNIVKLIGICWASLGTPKTAIMPVLTLEAAEFGDMETFLESHRDVSLQKILGLCLDIAEGIKAIHQIGIIHGDIKPRNVLIFKHNELDQIAKVADFGSAIILSEVSQTIRITEGTPAWQAPECESAIPKEGLVRIDMYALGLTIANFIMRNRFSETLKHSHSPKELRFRDDFVQCIALSIIESFDEPDGSMKATDAQHETGPGDATESNLRVIQDEPSTTNIHESATSTDSTDHASMDSYHTVGEYVAKLVHVILTNKPICLVSVDNIIEGLQYCLQELLFIRLVRDPQDFKWPLNSQETAVLLQPGKFLASAPFLLLE